MSTFTIIDSRHPPTRSPAHLALSLQPYTTITTTRETTHTEKLHSPPSFHCQASTNFHRGRHFPLFQCWLPSTTFFLPQSHWQWVQRRVWWVGGWWLGGRASSCIFFCCSVWRCFVVLCCLTPLTFASETKRYQRSSLQIQNYVSCYLSTIKEYSTKTVFKLKFVAHIPRVLTSDKSKRAESVGRRR